MTRPVWHDRLGDRPSARLVALGRALGHPVRIEILRDCCESGRSLHKPVDLARSLGLRLGVVSYHVRVLEELGLVELRGTEHVRGALAHQYALADGVAAMLARVLPDE